MHSLLARARSRSMAWAPSLIVAGLAVLFGVWHVSQEALAFLRGSADGDVLIYFLMGRAILEGWTPYIDLYESKPPGMFIIAALSLLLTGGHRLLMALGLVMLYGTPLLALFAAWRTFREGSWFQRIAKHLTVFSIAVFLTIYLIIRASGLETESFGAFFGCIYALLVFSLASDTRWQSVIWRAIPLFLAVFSKEPFVLTTMTAALVLSVSPKKFLQGFILPAILGGVFGVLLLALAGWLMPYLTVHLPVMFFGRPDASGAIPAYLQAIDPWHLWINFTAIFALPLFGWVMAMLWTLSPFFRSGSSRLLDAALSIATTVAGYFLLSNLGIILMVWFLQSKGFSLDDPTIFPSAVTKAFIFGPFTLGLLVWQWRKTALLPHTLIAFVALYVVSLTVVISGMSGNHYAAAVPVYFALILLLVAFWARFPSSVIPFVFVPLVAISLVFYKPNEDRKHYWEDSQKTLAITDADRAAFARFDDLLDACSIDRFGGSYYASIYGRHLLWGPLPNPGNFPALPPDHHLFTETQENLEKHNLVIIHPKSGGEDTIPDGFTLDAPSCAKEFVPIEGYSVLFRKDARTGE